MNARSCVSNVNNVLKLIKYQISCFKNYVVRKMPVHFKCLQITQFYSMCKYATEYSLLLVNILKELCHLRACVQILVLSGYLTETLPNLPKLQFPHWEDK